MFWDRNKRVARAIICSVAVIAATAMASPALAQSLVVRSTGPSAAQYPAGKKIAASGEITLKRGDRITVLDKGKTRVLTGPGTFSLSRTTSASKTSNRVASFVATGPRRRARTGAVRGVPSEGEANAENLAARSPNLWYVDVSRGGNHCLVKSEAVLLWRPEIVSDDDMKLSASSGGQAQIAWRRGSMLRRWPSDEVLVKNGATYALASAQGGAPVKVAVKLLPQEPADLDATAEALLANGCTNQLDLLVDMLAASETSEGAETAVGEDTDSE